MGGRSGQLPILSGCVPATPVPEDALPAGFTIWSARMQ